ncbi:hypothetical protein [Streptomyces griseus]
MVASAAADRLPEAGPVGAVVVSEEVQDHAQHGVDSSGVSFQRWPVAVT